MSLKSSKKMVRSPGMNSILTEDNCGCPPGAAGTAAAAVVLDGAFDGAAAVAVLPVFGGRLARSGPPRDFTDSLTVDPGANSTLGPFAATSIAAIDAAAPMPAPIAAPLPPPVNPPIRAPAPVPSAAFPMLLEWLTAVPSSSTFCCPFELAMEVMVEETGTAAPLCRMVSKLKRSEADP